jgi:hypothetical protein
MTEIAYGTKVKTRIIDDNGSTEERVENFRDWQLVRPLRVTYRIRHPVKDSKQEMEEYAKFSKDVGMDSTKFDIEFKVDKKKINGQGHYCVVWCYTQLEK